MKIRELISPHFLLLNQRMSAAKPDTMNTAQIALTPRAVKRVALPEAVRLE
jgi:hypothetical protein